MSKSHYLLDYMAWVLKTEQSKSLLDNGPSVPRYGAVPSQKSEEAHPASKKKTIGFWSAVFIIFNRIIGTGYVLILHSRSA